MKKNIVFVALFVLLVLGGVSGYLVYQNTQTHASSDIHSELSFASSAHSVSSISRDVPSNLTPYEEEDFERKSPLERPSKPTHLSHAIAKTNPKIPPKELKAPKESNSPPSFVQNHISQKPKMAIIMDDMAYPSQLKSLHQLALKITPSFFPYNLDNKLTPKMASEEPFYMVHLPLEALHFYQSPHRWIKVGETKSQIEEYIKEIKHDFPRLKFINNHTGSKFSASYEDMKNLIDVLRKYDIDFVDSRTTKETKAPQIYAQMKRPLLSRGIFLDNKESVSEIVSQIQKAIKKAKKDGYVIVICHPHKNTFKALELSKKSLEKEVQLVYVKEIQKMVLDEK